MKKLLLFPALLMLTAGCEKQPTEVRSKLSETIVYIDTIRINGHPHEYLIYNYGRSGQLSHSPECWCGKEVAE